MDTILLGSALVALVSGIIISFCFGIGSRYLPFLVIIAAMLSAGWITADWTASREAVRQQTFMLDRTQLNAESITVANLKKLSGNRSDTRNPAYHRIKKQLQTIQQVMPQIERLYLVRFTKNTVVYLADSLHASPGQPYGELPLYLQELAQNGGSKIIIPPAHAEVAVLSSFIPLYDAYGTRVLAVLGIDFNAAPYHAALKTERVRTVILFLLLCAALVLIVFYLQQRRLSEQGGIFEFPRSSLLRWGPTSAIILVGIVITSVSFHEARRYELDYFRTVFWEQATSRTETLVQSLFSSLDELDSVRRFLESSPSINRTMFDRYTGSITEHQMKGMAWIPRVTRSERAVFETRAHKDGFSQFRFQEKAPLGDFAPAADHENYYPVYYVVPHKENKEAHGFNLMSDHERRTALERARDEGLPTVTTPLRLITEKENQSGYLIFNPVYAPGKTESIEARLRTVRGFAMGIYRAGDMIGTIIARHYPTGLSFKVEDWDASPENRLLHLHLPRIGHINWEQPHHSARFERIIEFAGRQWVIRVLPGTAFIASHLSQWYWWIIPLGMGLTTLVCFYFNGVLVTRFKLAGLVKERTEELANEKDRLNITLRSICDGLIVVDGKGRIAIMNQVAEKLTGWKEAEAAGRPVEAVFSVSKDNANRNTLENDDLPGRTVPAVLAARGGGKHRITNCASPIRNREGTGIGTVLVFRDVSREYETEEQIRRLNMRFMLAAEAAGIGVWEWNIAENRLLCDQQTFHLYGMQERNFVMTYETWAACLHPDDTVRVHTEMKQALVSEKELDTEFRVLWPDGSTHFLKSSGRVERDETGRARHMTGISHDITERKRVEDELRESEKKYRGIFSSLVDIYYKTDLQGTILEVSPSVSRLAGYDLEDLIGRNTAFLYPKPEIRQKMIELLMKNGWINDYEIVLRKKDGTLTPVSVTSRIIMDEAGKPLYAEGSLRDITERKKAEMELRTTMANLQTANKELQDAIAHANAMAKQAEAANVAKSAFLANMSHEIRTPMNGVIGMTSLLIETELTTAQRDYAETIRFSAENLLTLLNDILDFSKIEAGKLTMETIDFNLRAMLDDFSTMLVLQARNKGLAFVYSMAPQVPSALRGDPGRLRQVLYNLAGNAVKFTAEGKIDLRATLLSETDTQAILRFSVRDTGIGIPESMQNKLFHSFTQIDASITRKYGGTGLGLAISKQLVELMNGEIGVLSHERKGSEFWFTAIFEKQKEKKAEPHRADITGSRILVVDGNAAGRSALVDQLASWGAIVSQAENGSAGIDLLHAAITTKNPFQVVILDKHLPGMDSETFGKTVKSDPAIESTRLIMITSCGERGDAKKMTEIGFSAYLTKPVQPRDLFQALRLVLGNTRASERGTQIITRHSIQELRRKQLRILLVEDHLINQKVALKMFEKLGYAAETVADGMQAIKTLETSVYDLVFMDIQMPEMNGYEATRVIRDRTSKVLDHAVPVIAMTAHAMQGDHDKCKTAGMNDYLTKPINIEVLRDLIEAYVRGPSAHVRDAFQTADEKPLVEKSIFDQKELRNRLDGDEKLIREIMAYFLKTFPGQIADLQKAVKTNNYKRIILLSHTIKGAAANISANVLGKDAALLEDAGHEENFKECNRLIHAMEHHFHELTNAVPEAWKANGNGCAKRVSEFTKGN
ncbi:MAG: PAS domain S-box protein [Nitrospirota bacterium]